MTDEEHSASTCPSCGRFVGPYARCPYCGADVGQRMIVRVFRIGSLVLAIGGVLVLLLVASRAEVPIVETGEMVGTMNWAYVHVEGVVSRQPSYDATAKALKFWVHDGSGEILVTAYRSEAEEIQAPGRMPFMGDQVALEGTLRIKEDFEYLVLNEPQTMRVSPATPDDLAIAEVDRGRLYQVVTLRGVIRDNRVPYEGLRILTLADATGEIDITLSSDTLALTEGLPDVTVGQSVRVTGAVDQYKGAPQISVGRGSDLVVLDVPLTIATQQYVGNLSVDDVGSLVLIEGVITKSNPFSAGTRLTLDDGSGSVILLLWQDLFDSLPQSDALSAGAVVRVLGKVAEYQGEVEVVPQLPLDVVVLASDAASIAERELRDLGHDDLGELIRVNGVLRTLRTFSAGVRGVLDDGTGTVTLLLWQEVYDGLSDTAGLAPGAMLQIEGEVQEYRGVLEVVPRAPADVVVEGMVEMTRQERAIGQITVDDVGQTVWLEGVLSDESSFSKGMKYHLEDDSGVITLLLWQDLHGQMADAHLLTPGAHVAVSGEIREFAHELEIVPQFTGDVEVLESEGVTVDAVEPCSEATVVALENKGSLAGPTVFPTEEPLQPSLSPTAPPTPSFTPTPSTEIRAIGDISGSDVGQEYTITTAGITGLDYFSKGVKYTLSDSTGEIILLLWQDVLEEIPDRYALIPGSQVQATGRIDQYAGDLELIPREGARVVLQVQAETLPVEARKVKDISPSDEGRIFTVEGVVARTEVDGWLKIWLGDSTGEILVFVPERTVPYLPSALEAGTQLQVTGEVDIYNGTLEIIPLAGADVGVH